MTISISTGVCIIALLLVTLGFMFGYIIGRPSVDKHIGCETCKHSKHGKYVKNNPACIKCETLGVFTGWERR